jgi:hypothetical protein
MFLLAALIWFILAIIGITVYVADGGKGMLVLGIFGIFAMVICGVAAMFMKRTVIDAIDQGRFHDAKNDSIVWVMFGLIGFGLPAILLVLTYVKLSDAIAQQGPGGYQPYAPATVSAQSSQQQYVPPPVPPQPAPPHPQAQHPQHAQHQPMVRCKNCNVQFPTFMHSCPNCGAPREQT